MNAGIKDDFAENWSGRSMPQVNNPTFNTKADRILASAAFWKRWTSFLISAKKVIGANRAMVEIPTTIKSTICGKTRAIERAMIPKTMVVYLMMR